MLRLSLTNLRRRGFTLVELLVVMMIMITLLAIATAAIKINIDADRVRGAARSVQSYFLGGRDRAIYAKAPRGVRLILNTASNSANPRTVSSMVFIEPTDPWVGQVQIMPFNTAMPWNSVTNPMNRVRLRNVNEVPNWQQLNARNLLVDAARPRIQIPATDRGVWYTIATVDVAGAFQDVILTTEYRNPNSTALNDETAQIELPPVPIPNEEPFQLPRNVVIDLDACSSNRNFTPPNKLPGTWTYANPAGPPPAFLYRKQLDVLFSPRGAVTGPSASSGVIHLYVTEQAAADNQLDAAYTGGGPIAIPDKFAVSIFTRTGNIIVSPINATDAFNNGSGAVGADGIADDPFFYPERGEVAGR